MICFKILLYMYIYVYILFFFLLGILKLIDEVRVYLKYKSKLLNLLLGFFFKNRFYFFFFYV